MTDIEKAREMFRDEGLAFPAIPEKLAAQLKEQDRWVFATRPIDVSLYNLQHYVEEVERTQVKNYAVLAHSGHGVNSYAIQYYLVHESLSMFLHLAWGGIYSFANLDAANIRDCFLLADQVVASAQKVGEFEAGERLTIVGSDLYGSYWLPPGENRPGKYASIRSHRSYPMVMPPKALTEVLGWLANQKSGDI